MSKYTAAQALSIFLRAFLQRRDRRKDRDTGAVALDHTLEPGVAWKLHEIRLHLSGAGADEAFTATLDSGTADAYDLLLFSQNTNGITDVLWQPDQPLHFDADDEVDFALTNSNTETYGLEVVYSEV